ncbi:hypothetical protein N185_18670 [Sinorhizobium sp. GW3]|jgi:hypothetical protein|nr:hypothetical protein N185_18670 [Sinorhizobium sp. GW3]KSV82031.1 hypothetical protein N182_14590 [Sinorhizobium sp. GL2]
MDWLARKTLFAEDAEGHPKRSAERVQSSRVVWFN